MLFVVFPLLLLIFVLCVCSLLIWLYVSWGVSPWVYSVWDSLGFLDLDDNFLPHFREVFNYYLLKYFLMVFLFVCFGVGRGFSLFLYCLDSFTGEGNGTPLQYSCLENPRDGGAWWASIHGVAQSRTQLKRLSSSSSRFFYPRFHL